MNNLKKLGLSALAGSLVAISANAAELTVTGSVEVTYVDTDGTHGNELTGNSFGAKSDMTFAGSGDVGFGTVTMNRALSDTGAITTSYQTLDMGDLGILSFDSKAGALVGIKANDDLMPTAYEEMWTGVSSSGISGVGSTNVIGYQNTFMGVSISAGYQNGVGGSQQGESGSAGTKDDTTLDSQANGHGSITDIYLSMAVYDGLTVGVGVAENSSTNTSNALNTDSKEAIMNAVYSTGPVSVGYRLGQNNSGTAATASVDIEAVSVAFNVNDNFAISYGMQEKKQTGIGAVVATTEEVDGISAAYTMGAASIRVNHSKSQNDGFEQGVDYETTEVSLALSF